MGDIIAIFVGQDNVQQRFMKAYMFSRDYFIIRTSAYHKLRINFTRKILHKTNQMKRENNPIFPPNAIGTRVMATRNIFH